MFRRKVYNDLLNWKENFAGKYAVMLEGARRVGKSTIAEYFAKENYDSYILLDFSEVSNEIKSLFEDLYNMDFFFLKLQSLTQKTLYEHKSLIIFDEVQLYPKARQAIKHLVKDGRYDYLETGSLISINKNVKDIVIPSEEMKIQVYPLDYEEFMDACGNDTYHLFKDMLNARKPIGNDTNRILMRNFRIYMAVGGMPQAVAAYVNKQNFQEIDRIKKEIISLYLEDFRKIDPSGRISEIYESIPSQLSLKKTKFFLTKALKKKKSTSKDLELLYDLINSKTVLPCYNVTDPSIALNLTKDYDKFKLYISDTGLFTTMLFNDKNSTNENIYNKLLSDKLDANLGYLYENAIAQIISVHNRNLYYHTWSDNTESHNHEIDFLVTDRAKIIPIEVKSSNIKNHESIKKFSEKFSKVISRRILFSQNDISNDYMIELLPIYLASSFLDGLN